MRGCAPAGERAGGSIRGADDAGLLPEAGLGTLAERSEAAKVLVIAISLGTNSEESAVITQESSSVPSSRNFFHTVSASASESMSVVVPSYFKVSPAKITVPASSNCVFTILVHNTITR